MRLIKSRYYSSGDLEKILKPSIDFLKVSVIALSSPNNYKVLKNVVVYLYEKARQNFKCFKDFYGYEYNHDAPVITYNNLKYFLTIMVLDILCKSGYKVKSEDDKKKLISELSEVLYELIEDSGVSKIAEKDAQMKNTLESLEFDISRIAEEIVLVEK